MTKPEVFIVESLTLGNEKNELFEGKLLAGILKMWNKDTPYYYIRTKRELERILREFDQRDSRYLHISCHGNNQAIYTTLDPIPFNDLGDMLRPYLNKKRIFLSACQAVRRELARELFKDYSGCNSLIGPRGDIYFTDAALVWASYYHLMFRKDNAAMNRNDIITTLKKIYNTFDVYFRYYAASSNTTIGFERIDWIL